MMTHRTARRRPEPRKLDAAKVVSSCRVRATVLVLVTLNDRQLVRRKSNTQRAA